MSRIGKQPIIIPSGAKVQIQDGVVKVEGPKGKLSYVVGHGVSAAVEDGQVVVTLLAKDSQARANYGTTRSHINNMVLGVTTGWQKALELNGVGFTASMKGSTLILNTGYSHESQVEIPKEITCKTEKTKIDLECADKELVGQVAARIRKICPPEPYLGKGIKYADEHVRRKAGKTGK